MSQPTPDQVVAAYVATREEMKRMEEGLELRLKPMKELQERREEWLLQQINQSGLKNLPTLHGTAYITRAESITIADWDLFLQYILENEAWEFLERRASKKAVQELMGEERDRLPPPGVNYTAVQKIGVRKS